MIEPEILQPLERPNRPTDFSDEIFDTVCERMMGGEWLRKICDGDPEMPRRQTFLRWIEKDTGRQEKYARASRAMVDYWAEELLEISQETEKDTIIEPGGRRKCNHEWVANKRLHSENLRFLMSKIYPKRYGDKLEVSPDPAAPGQNLTNRWIARVIVWPMIGADGRTIKEGTPEYEEAMERAARAAFARGERQTQVGINLDDTDRAQPPAQIAYKPDPLPGNLSPEAWSLLTEVLNLIRRTIPTNDDSPPETIFRIIREALLMHFREVEIDGAELDRGITERSSL